MKTQDLYFELMKLASFNGFDGEKVVKSLKDNTNLWRGAIFGRFDGYAELIPLRDIQSGNYNADTLYITPVKHNADKLRELAETWNADEVDWIDADKACSLLGYSSPETRVDNKQLLRIWWD